MTEFRIQFFIGRDELGALHERITGLKSIRDWEQQLVVSRQKANGTAQAQTPTKSEPKAKGPSQALVLRVVKRAGGRARVSDLRKALERADTDPGNLSTICKRLGLKRVQEGTNRSDALYIIP